MINNKRSGTRLEVLLALLVFTSLCTIFFIVIG